MNRILPDDPIDFLSWSWTQIEPIYQDLEKTRLSSENLEWWLAGWSQLSGLIFETQQRLYAAHTMHTDDRKEEKRYNYFLDKIYARAEAEEKKLKAKLLNSGLSVSGLETSLRRMEADCEIFSQANLPLLAQEMKLSARYDRIIGEQVIDWNGKRVTLMKLQAVLRDPDDQTRELAWRTSAERWLKDREAINSLWIELLELRQRVAANAGLTDYRAFRWKKLHRFDYSPSDCERFQRTIERVIVPAARELYEKRRQRLGLKTLRPWDLKVESSRRPRLCPFESIKDLEAGAANIFRKVDPKLGDYFEIMRQEGLLDLENRAGKAPGGYCAEFLVSGRPFIFMNGVGIQEDVQTLLHEGGHAFHVFESNDLPYFQQRLIGLEFMEVASTAMELLSAAYLIKDEGGFYSRSEAAQARIELLEEAISFWPYMAVVDAFQHWVYTDPAAAINPMNCDQRWSMLWSRFMGGTDWNGLETEKMTGWQRKAHILQDPFYYVEYGFAHLGAFQIWENAIRDRTAAIKSYRKALALGGTRSIPELYAAAGANFRFDDNAMRRAIDLGMNTIEALEHELS